jgi:hypothetical protein
MFPISFDAYVKTPFWNFGKIYFTGMEAEKGLITNHFPPGEAG